MTGPRFNGKKPLVAIVEGDRVRTSSNRRGRVVKINADATEALVWWDNGEEFWLRFAHLQLEERS